MLIWKEQQGQGAANSGWAKVKEHTLHTASGGYFWFSAMTASASQPALLVNSVCWAPHELGAILACASSDGKLSVLTFKSESYSTLTSNLASNFDSPN